MRPFNGMRPESIRRVPCQGIRSWSDLDPYSENLLRIGLYTPVPYLPDWVPTDHAAELAWASKRAEKLNFRVKYDGADLRRPIAFCDPDSSFVSPFRVRGKEVSARATSLCSTGSLGPRTERRANPNSRSECR
jgi:hypothetical protein